MESREYKFIYFRSKASGNVRAMTVIDGQPYYKSTGKNSGEPETWFPFISVKGTKPILFKNIPAEFQPYWLRQAYVSSAFPSQYIVKFESSYLVEPDEDLSRWCGRIPTQKTLITAKRLSGDKFPTAAQNILEERKLSDQITPIKLAKRATFLTEDPDEANLWLMSQGATLAKDLLFEKELKSQDRKEPSKTLSDHRWKMALENYINYKNRFFGIRCLSSSFESYEAAVRLNLAKDDHERYQIAEDYVKRNPKNALATELKKVIRTR